MHLTAILWFFIFYYFELPLRLADSCNYVNIPKTCNDEPIKHDPLLHTELTFWNVPLLLPVTTIYLIIKKKILNVAIVVKRRLTTLKMAFSLSRLITDSDYLILQMCFIVLMDWESYLGCCEIVVSLFRLKGPILYPAIELPKNENVLLFISFACAAFQTVCAGTRRSGKNCSTF